MNKSSGSKNKEALKLKEGMIVINYRLFDLNLDRAMVGTVIISQN